MTVAIALSPDAAGTPQDNYDRLERPNDALGHYLLGVTLYTVKRSVEARDAFQKSLTFGPNADSEYMLGLITQTGGDNAGAVRWLQRISESASCYPAAQTLIGIAYAELNNMLSARIALERAIQLNLKICVHTISLDWFTGNLERKNKRNRCLRSRINCVSSNEVRK